MKLSKYDSNLHFDIICEWLKGHDQKPPKRSEMPANGYIVYTNIGHVLTPIACGFLRLVEGNYAQIDGLCVDPTIRGNIRNEALNEVASKLISLAKELNITKLFSFSTNKKTVTRSMDFGFVQLPHSVIILDSSSKE